MKSLTYQTFGTCSKFINVSIDDDGLVSNVQFIGGCAGNTTGIAQLVRGMRPEDVIKRLEGVRCGYKPTSCPDQLTQALRKLMSE